MVHMSKCKHPIKAPGEKQTQILKSWHVEVSKNN